MTEQIPCAQPAPAWDRDAAIKQIADERGALLQAKYSDGWTAEQEARFEQLNADMTALSPHVTDEMVSRLEAIADRLVPAPEGAQATPGVPACKVVDIGFRWDGEAQHHVPKLVIEFEPVPANSPCDAKGWRDRDALVAALAAKPEWRCPDTGRTCAAEDCGRECFQAPAEGDDLAAAAAALVQAVQRDWPGAPSHRATVLAAAGKVQQVLAARPNVQPKGMAGNLTDGQLIEAGKHRPSNTPPWGIGSTREDFLRAARAVITADRAAQSPAPVPEIDYTALIHAGFERHKYRQGTNTCIAFKNGAQWFREQVVAQAPAVQDGAEAALAHIAALAHEGGLAKLNEGGALSHIRRLCLPYWDDKGNHAQQTHRVQAAIDAALGKVQPPVQHPAPGIITRQGQDPQGLGAEGLEPARAPKEPQAAPKTQEPTE